MDADEYHRHSYSCRRDDSAGEEFDFAFVTTRDSESTPQVSADQIFEDGKIRPAYPIFVRDSERPKTRNPLAKLFTEEKVTTTKTDVAAPAEEGMWRKSTSAAGGNSKRWKLKNLMNRSKSVGRKKDDEKRAPAGGGRVRPTPPATNRDRLLHFVGLFGNGNGMRKNSKQH